MITQIIKGCHSNELAISEAEEIIGRILPNINCGRFEYVSSITHKGYVLVIRPEVEAEQCGQPYAEQVILMYDVEQNLIAKFLL